MTEILTGRPATLAPNGMVTSPHSLASAAGVDVLRAGGSAVDAAVATSAALSVLYPHMTGVWRLLLHEVFSKLGHRPHFFFDLVDPSGRSADDIRAMLETLPMFELCGPVTLGLNGNEANILARLTGLREAASERDEVLRLAGELRGMLGLSTVVIHRNKFAVGAGADDSATVDGPHCARPVKSTGAGDRFNAGCIFGLLLGSGIEESIVLGCATAGLFVRTGESPTREALSDFLRAWEVGFPE